MAVRLQQGGNLVLSSYAMPDQPVQIGVSWRAADGTQALDIDVSAFLVTAAGRVRNDDDFVFYNQPSAPGGSVQWAKAATGGEDAWLITIVPAHVPPEVAKVVVAATIHEGLERRQSFGQLQSAYGRLLAGGQEQIRYDVQVAGMPETALLLMELYRHSSGWKLRAIGQGFVGGLGPLAQSMGVDIESEAAEASPVSDGLTIPAGAPPAEVQSSTGGRARSVAGSGTPPPAAPAPARSGPQSQQSGNRCSRCGRPFGLLDRISGNRGLCGRCRNEVAEALRRFRLAFLAASSENYVTDSEWQSLLAQTQAAGIELPSALEFIRADALHSLERLLTFHFADGILSPEEEQEVRDLKVRYAIPDSAFRSLEERITRLKHLTAIREGNLPAVQLPRGMHLETDEICHLHTHANYVKVTARGEQLVSGEMVATNRKLLFTSPTGAVDIKWKSVVRIEQQPYSVYLELTKRSATGHYRVDDPEQVTALLDTLVRIANRQLVGTSIVATRHIPQPVKIAVWQRDGGKCVECGADQYLEFDHIIPYSRGGASTEGNVQLLCRACNLKKGDRI